MPTSLTYPSNRTIDYTYDSVNRLSAITDHGTSETYASGIAYTSAGQIDNFNIGNTSGQRKESYTYNNRLQLATQKVQVGSSPELLNLTYSYAGASGDHGAGTGAGNTGQLISMSDSQDSTKSVNYTYDLLGRLKTAQTPSSGWSVKETYDRYGNRWQQDRVGNSTTLPSTSSGTITFSGSEKSTTIHPPPPASPVTIFDGGGFSITIGSYSTTAGYGSSSTSSTLATQLANTLNNDATSPVTAVASGATVTLTSKGIGTAVNYSLSAANTTWNTTWFSTPSFTASTSSGTMSGGASGSLGSGGTGPQSNLSFDLNNHINTTGYTYDNAGNLTADPVYTYTHDGENRQTQVSDGSVTTTYGYNSDPQRMIRTSGGVSTFYIYGGDGQQLAEQVGASGTWHDYIYLGDRLLADVTSSSGTTTATTYHYPDRASTRLTTDAGGSVLSRQQTAPFGEVQTDTSSSATKRKFTSYERDSETGNDFAINRQFTAANARFTQPDPSGMASAGIANPQSLNQYAYALNDPANMSDPLGLESHVTHEIIDGAICDITTEDDGYQDVYCFDGGGQGGGGGVGGGEQGGGGQLQGASASGKARNNKPCGDSDRGGYNNNQIAAVIGGKVVISNNTNFITNPKGLTFSQIVSKLQAAGITEFTNFNSEHSGSINLGVTWSEDNVPEFYHVNVFWQPYKVDPELNDQMGHDLPSHPSKDPNYLNLPPTQITVHCDRTGIIDHFLDFLKKTFS